MTALSPSSFVIAKRRHEWLVAVFDFLWIAAFLAAGLLIEGII